MIKQFVTVRCIFCGEKRDIGPGEIPVDEHPMCEKCFGPTVPVKATGDMECSNNS